MNQVTPGVARIWLGLALIVAPVLALLGLETYVVLGSTPELRQNRELVSHTFDFISTAQTLQRSIQDAERGERGFLLTGNPDYLEPYRKSSDEIPTLLAKLKQLAAGNAEHQRRIQELERQIAVKLEELRRALALAASQGNDAAARAMHSNVGLIAMESITALIDGAVAGENFRLTDQLQHAADDERRVMRMGIVGAVLALLVIALGAIVAWLALRRIIVSEAARHESEERFRLLVDDVTDYAIYMLDPDGRVSTWNAGAQRIKGYPADEIVGEHFSRFFTEDDSAAGEPQRVLSAARAGRYAGEHWRVRKGGERFFASVTVNPVRDASGTLIGFAKITRDISERLAQQQSLEQARAELAQSQKMEALGQLSGGVAHDFNNVLHVINNAVTILLRRLDGADPEVRKFLDMIKRNADRAASLTQRLLAFSRTQPLDPVVIDPNALVSGLVDLLRQTLGTTIDIDTRLGDALWQISADTNQLETAII
ncbi:MAG: CHASE3 domain-containing protein, partial [Betaproteobacteria bacterium]